MSTGLFSTTKARECVLRWVAFGGLVTLLLSCSDKPNPAGLKPGDILFQDLNCGDLCDAIEAVTEGVDGKDFSHCGMVVSINDTLRVVEAIGREVQATSLRSFFARTGDTTRLERVTIGRVRAPFESLIAPASEFARQQIGQPYDDAFLLNNGKWYCSELLFEAFKEANEKQDFFHLSPMTFQDPETRSFFPAWIDYYQQLGVDIPEGEPGLNPGSISRSDKLEIVHLDGIAWLSHE